MTRGFLGSGIAAIIETALSPLDPNGRIPIRVKIVCTSGGNRLLRTPFIAIRMERLAEETDKVSVERLWKRFQRSGTIKSIESLLLSFFFFSLFLSLQSQEVYPNGRLSVVSQPCVSLRTKRNNNLLFIGRKEDFSRNYL